MTTEEMIAVMQAYQRGETAQYRLRGDGEEWTDMDRCIPGNTFRPNFGKCDYRIKPAERKPREFTVGLIDGVLHHHKPDENRWVCNTPLFIVREVIE